MAPKYKLFRRRPAAAIRRPAAARYTTAAVALDTFPTTCTWRQARLLFGRIAPTLDIKVAHSVQHPTTGKWKSLTPDQLRQVIQRRQTHMAGSMELDEWAHRARVPGLEEIGAGYFFW
jgi:hypothetical protein